MIKLKPARPAAYQVVNQAGQPVALDDNLARAQSLCRVKGDHLVPLYTASAVLKARDRQKLYAEVEAERTLVRRAFQIADESMRDVLYTQAMPIGKTPLFRLFNAKGLAVRRLNEASPAIQDTYAWLSKRGVAELVDDGEGEYIRLK